MIATIRDMSRAFYESTGHRLVEIRLCRAAWRDLLFEFGWGSRDGAIFLDDTTVRPMSRLEDLMELTSVSGWDDEDSQPIGLGAWSYAQWVVQAVRLGVPAAPEVFYSASGDGEVHIRWDDATRSVRVSLAPLVAFCAVRAPDRIERSTTRTVQGIVDVVKSVFG